uniref:CHR910 n=1 Tax=Arundo donax TaxID=35708 RepID=A0A0A9EKS1_ARUDO
MRAPIKLQLSIELTRCILYTVAFINYYIVPLYFA